MASQGDCPAGDRFPFPWPSIDRVKFLFDPTSKISLQRYPLSINFDITRRAKKEIHWAKFIGPTLSFNTPSRIGSDKQTPPIGTKQFLKNSENLGNSRSAETSIHLL